MPRPGRLAAELSLSVVSGAALALCLPKPGLCFLGWFALVPLLVLLYRAAPKRAAGLGLAAGAGFNGLAFYWIYSTCRFASVPVPVALLAWGALTAFLALSWGMIGWLGAKLANRLPAAARAFGWALVWTAVTVAWERWTPRPCADLLEYTQWKHLSLIQIASVLGPHGLGLLIAWVNASLAQAWLESKPLRPALPVALVLAAWGFGRHELASRPASEKTVPVEILQPDVDEYAKWDPGSAARIDDDFSGLLGRPRSQDPAIVVWPEASVPRILPDGATVPEAEGWSRKLKAFQIVGAVTQSGTELFNSAVLLDAAGAFRGVYHKRELVPFGEYVPFAFLRRFIGILDELGGIAAGAADQPLLRTPAGPAAATICYEAVFPRWTRRDAARGAGVIFNLTNDGWYKDTWGPYQHFETNVFRAVENRVSVVRAGNSGISAVIDPWGVVTARLGLDRRGRLDAALPAQDPFPARSFYARHGDWFGTLCLLALALLAANGLLLSRRA